MKNRFRWETLYPTTGVGPREGSQGGSDCRITPLRGRGEWSHRAGHTRYFVAAGLIQLFFQEQLLAGRLARYLRRKDAPPKDVQGVEAAVGGGLGLLSLLSVGGDGGGG